MPEAAITVPKAPGGGKNNGGAYVDRDKPAQIRFSNISAGKAVADAIRTSLGPKGMDKMIQDGKGDVIITNDGATILKQMQVLHPAAKMLVDLSKAQDIEAGDGTTSVVVIAGALLDSCARLLQKGIHPTTISESFQKAVEKGVEILTSMSQPVELSDRETLLNSATTSLCSKVVSQYSSLLAPMSVDAVMRVIDPATATSVDLRDINIVKKLGGTIDDCELVEGLVLTQRVVNSGLSRVEKAKIGLIQFCLSPPKTDMDNQIVVSDYEQMDRVLREERAYILNLVKQIKKAGCNVLLIQKSILRDALSDLALHFLNKMKIMVVKDIERDEIEFICKTIGTKPIAHVDQFVPEMLGSAELVEEVSLDGSGKLVKITGCSNPGKTVSIVVRGSNKLVIEEAERSIHDALCVIRCLVKRRALIAGGGAPEIELALRLAEYSRSLAGMEAYCVRAYADALEVIPSTLAENAGLNPISTVTELRNRHAQGEITAGINVRKGGISNILEELVVQPLLVSISALTLATETVRSILKIDDIKESDSESDPGTDDTHAEVSCPLPITHPSKMGDHIDLHELYLSNEQYYRKREQLRRAHLHTMADLELMYLKKLELKDSEPLSKPDRACLLQCHQINSTTGRKLKKSHELCVDEVRNGDHVNQNITKDLLSSPKEHINNMWQGFRIDKTSPNKQKPSSTSLENYPGDRQATAEPKRVQRSTKGRGRSKEEGWRPQVTVPKPFQMTLREMEYKRKVVRSRAEIERENEELRREIEELTECQRKFRATAVPAHVRMPLYEELRERDEERRRQLRAAEQRHLLTTQRPFSFLEREQIKKQQKELTKEQEDHRRRPFRAKPVPRAVKESATGERQKEEQLYREIKKEMRATEMLLSVNEPPSVLSKRLSERRMQRQEQSKNLTIGIRINSQVPDFDASYRRFQKQLERKRVFRPLTACEPFKLCTANISPCKERLTADTDAGGRSQSASQCLFVSLSPRTPSSSVCSSLSGSREYLPSKITDAAKKRQEAVRKVLEQRKKAEQEEEERKERQKQKERKLQKLIAKRAQANDPHVALAQICESKLKQFRKQDLQRRREYEEEMREIQERVKSRPLLLERVTQMNAKKAAEKCYTDVLRTFGLSEAFINSKAPTIDQDYTLSGHSVSHTPLTHRMDQTSDHLDYPEDYEDYEQDGEDVLMDRKNEIQQEDEGEKLDKGNDPGEDGDGGRSYEDNLDFDDYDDQDGDESGEGCGDRSHSRHSNTSRASDDGKSSTSPLSDDGKKEDRKSRRGSQESVSDEETEKRQRREEKDDDKD
ncbi:hypothetical protein QTP86_014162 [Hemibagrus guttatus]|nr:hypothetical protein QTP86_014162 [Hemibagrus guttatus]